MKKTSGIDYIRPDELINEVTEGVIKRIHHIIFSKDLDETKLDDMLTQIVLS